ncbi:MAG: DUF2330 domain-containing protein [Planctomycetes bacterium]|nr:DUF2330 domain-containing protein [Planctomycetota bacterium]
MRLTTGLSAALLALFLAGPLAADPCGMVPPLWEGEGPAITRVGVQQTYVFYKEGVESFVIRPGFQGKVDEFGMLIPFPSVPTIRKVDDDIFGHLALAVDPPKVVVDLRPQRRYARVLSADVDESSRNLQFEAGAMPGQVVVLKQEAVGMYEVAVLSAGSAGALGRWMEDHGYHYPDGMDTVIHDYVKLKWCFVAVKAKVGKKPGVTPHAGMREAKPNLPKGATFDGNVQAMGFRFRTPELVVPMRLSAFNAGELNNRIYLLTDRPQKIEGIPEEFVVKQLPGRVLRGHVTQLLPLQILGGTIDDLSPNRIKSLAAQRDPEPKNGLAKVLFAGDLESVRLDSLILPHEEAEKELLKIGERLGLRGEELDALHRSALQAARRASVERSLAALDHMTLTIVEGNFPRETLAKDNLHFSEFIRKDLDASLFPAPILIKAQAQDDIVSATTPLPRDPHVMRTPEVPEFRGMWTAIACVLGLTFVCGFIARRHGV